MFYIISPISLICCIVALTFMYIYVLKDNKKSSFFLPIIVIEYVDRTKKNKGFVGVWFWVFVFFFIIGLLTVSIAPP